MAKNYYTLDEAVSKLGCTADQLRSMVRSGKLREFRDAGKVNYLVEEVDRLASSTGENVRLEDSSLQLEGSSELSLSIDDSHEIPLSPEDSKGSAKGDSDAAQASGTSLGLSGSGSGLQGSDAPIDLGGSSGDLLSLGGTGSGELRLEDSGGVAPPEGSGGADALSLDEVDQTAVEGMKKDDTVITNIGISVFDGDDLEISADPMAKTVLTSGDDNIGLDGSSAGSGLLDLTRESDDTSLGAELLEGIDSGDTGETAAPPPQTGEPEPLTEQAPGLGESELASVPGGTVTLATVPAASPAFTGMLTAATIALALVGAMTVAINMETWPAYLNLLAGQFWFFLAGTVVMGALFAGVGYLVGKQSGPRELKPAKDKKAKKGKGKKGVSEEPQAEVEAKEAELDVETLK